MNEVKLKQCPFCGKSAPIVCLSREKEPNTGWQYQVVCDYNFGGCGSSGGFDQDPKKAVAIWNRRISE